MAFLKQAKAVVVHPRISGRVWGGIRKSASSGPTADLTAQARGILGEGLHSDTYLVTHCTIVASVDVDAVPGVRLGNVKTGSSTVNRRWDDYYIRPQCSQFVNNNGDAWSRSVLRMAYPTFVGGHNFQEHVQIEEQSKGRIIDAVARDIGDSLYVDILVATHRKHAVLVQDIQAGKMATLSMGCTTDFTICTKCGHYAVDETQLCEHVRYAKLNTFMDEAGQKRVIAELCGHKAYDENPDAPGGVSFIEASWVAVPAFAGAVMRNILSPGEVPAAKVRKVMASPPTEWSSQAALKAASLRTVQAFEFGSGEEGEEGEEGEGEGEATAEAPAPFQDAEDSLYNALKSRVVDRLQREIAQENVEAEMGSASPMDPNDNIIKEGSAQKYATSLQVMTRVASSPIALIEGVATINASYGIRIGRDVYRTILGVGAHSQYPSLIQFRQACCKAAGRDLTTAEIRVVVRLGLLLSRWEQHNNPPTTPSE